MARFKSFHEAIEADLPKDIYHEITWYIPKQMTLEEWAKLDRLMSEALLEVVGEDFWGVAGPIPEIG